MLVSLHYEYTNNIEFERLYKSTNIIWNNESASVHPRQISISHYTFILLLIKMKIAVYNIDFKGMQYHKYYLKKTHKQSFMRV